MTCRLARSLSLWALPVLMALGPARAHADELRLRIHNTVGGAVEVSADGGHSYAITGHVTVPAIALSKMGFTASAWAAPGTVAATSVNAIHVRVGTNGENGRATIFSIVPGGRLIGAARRQASTAIVTDVSGGEGIFGWGWGPYVGSPVYLEKDDHLQPLPAEYVPAEGDCLVITAGAPERRLRSVTFVNRTGGKVSLEWSDGVVEDAGVVDHPVTGIGRFEGAVYAAAGRLRANHPGVIDISTSPPGMIGGFQIIPRRHARSPEMAAGIRGGQWLVIGPPDPEGDWAGLPPLFSGYLTPSFRRADLTGDAPDWRKRVLARAQVQVRYGEGPWEPMPRIAFGDRSQRDTGQRTDYGRRGLWVIPAQPNPGLPLSAAEREAAGAALTDVTALRLLLPWNAYPIPPAPGDTP